MANANETMDDGQSKIVFRLASTRTTGALTLSHSHTQKHIEQMSSAFYTKTPNELN